MGGLLSESVTVSTVDRNGVAKKVWSEKKYQKAVKFMFGDGSSIDGVFQFSLQPQSIEISFPQRIVETKTFGGSVVEDYGKDTSAITIQGTTVNSDVRYFICGKSDSQEAKGTGYDELAKFKEMLDQYASVDKLQKKYVEMSYDEFSSRVFIKNFSIKQSKENPLAYNYTIELIGTDDTSKSAAVGEEAETVYIRIPQYNSSFQQDISGTDGYSMEVFENPEEAAALLESAEISPDSVVGQVNFLESFLGGLEGFRNQCANIRSAVADYGNRLRNFTQQLMNPINQISQTIEETVSLGDDIVTTAARTVDGVVNDVLGSGARLVNAVDGGVNFFRNFPEKYGSLPSDIVEEWGRSSDEIIETCIDILGRSEDTVEELTTEVQQTASSLDVAVIPGDADTDDQLVLIFGSTPYVVTTGDTWDSIAARLLEDPSLGLMISTYNNNNQTQTDEQNADEEGEPTE